MMLILGKMYAFNIVLVLALCGLLHTTTSSRVLELSDRFVDLRNDGQWLVMFYAPWCAHCKRLEPVWAHVAQALHHTTIRVGRLDCTRYTHIATKFKVQGFPTIMFLKGEQDHIYHGDRTKEELLAFAHRMKGPPVQVIPRHEVLTNLKNSVNVFFVYVGKQNGALWKSFHSISEVFQPHCFFYAASHEVSKEHFPLIEDHAPTVFVIKEKDHYKFTYDSFSSSILNETLYQWVNEERFGTFPKVTRGNINQILQTKKYIVLAVVEENKLNEIEANQLEFRDMVESVIRQRREQFHSTFQFGWIGSPELANSIAMSDLPVPHLLVLNSTTSHHHLPQDEPARLTHDALVVFLEQIGNQSAPTYGGNSFPVRMYRAYFEARTTLSDMWHGNPVLTAVLFGLPCGFLGLICYSICCADILDADEEDSDNDDGHEKKE
ncbi:protein disulfide-isomerase TMX3-like isoform X2 [Ctenocephalides felis]|uniref:protein disulfide-isomerase TMX3-like isoform X2 n=1 Tax=Ctenocephalides felis TaxID=7515 RepID=UPI000E6E17FC|nr:protein disulfide-isomerase TMX3-like isoform X2 [Ctenocephalides felis]